MHFFCFTKAKDPKHSWSFLPSRLRRSLSDFEISRFLFFFSLGGLGLTVYKFDQCFASVWNISHSTSPCFIVGTVRQSRDKHYHQYVLCLLHRCLASRTNEIQIAMLHLNTLAPRLIWQRSLDALCQHWMHVSTPLAPRDCISKFANCRLMHLHFAAVIICTASALPTPSTCTATLPKIGASLYLHWCFAHINVYR